MKYRDNQSVIQNAPAVSVMLLALGMSFSGGICRADQPAPAAETRLPKLMDREKEIALALSSCPAPVAGKAAVYVLESSGYVKARESQNGFTAIVQHALPTSQDPQCMDAEGTRTILPRYLKVAELRGSRFGWHARSGWESCRTRLCGGGVEPAGADHRSRGRA